tara:strand:+ start:172 stop:387 length:216 start_codon:yes stop_codon:yes gene_type:complete
MKPGDLVKIPWYDVPGVVVSSPYTKYRGPYADEGMPEMIPLEVIDVYYDSSVPPKIQTYETEWLEVLSEAR